MRTGRPKKFTKSYIEEIISKIENYIDETEIPIVVEFCYKNNIRKQRLYDIPEFSDCIKRLINKKEAQLERLGLEKNNTMAIFSLKQLGWRDTQEIQHSFNPEKAKEEIQNIFLTG